MSLCSVVLTSRHQVNAVPFEATQGTPVVIVCYLTVTNHSPGQVNDQWRTEGDGCRLYYSPLRPLSKAVVLPAFSTIVSTALHMVLRTRKSINCHEAKSELRGLPRAQEKSEFACPTPSPSASRTPNSERVSLSMNVSLSSILFKLPIEAEKGLRSQKGFRQTR